MIDHLLFYVKLKNFSLIWRRHHCRRRAGKLGTFKQGGIFIVLHLLWHGTLFFPVSSEELPHLVAFHDTQGDFEDLF